SSPWCLVLGAWSLVPGPSLVPRPSLVLRPSWCLWSSQDLVETVSARRVSGFELLRTETAQMAVAAGSIVEGIDVGGDIGDRQVSVLVDLLLDPLLLEAPEEGLGDGVVPAVTLPAHARLEMMG